MNRSKQEQRWKEENQVPNEAIDDLSPLVSNFTKKTENYAMNEQSHGSKLHVVPPPTNGTGNDVDPHRATSPLTPYSEVENSFRSVSFSTEKCSSDRARGRTISTDSKNSSKRSCFDYTTTQRYVGTIVPKKGWLFIGRKHLRARYVVLSGQRLKYNSEPGKRPKGFGTVTSLTAWDGHPFGLQFQLEGATVLNGYAKTQEEQTAWIDYFDQQLNTIVSRNGPRSSSRFSICDTPKGTAPTLLHEGLLHLQGRTVTSWKRKYFSLASNAQIVCRDGTDSSAPVITSGYATSVVFADCHKNAFEILLDGGRSLIVYSETYENMMIWFVAIQGVVDANSSLPQTSEAVRQCHLKTPLSNHSGWMYKKSGLFHQWKIHFFTLHGNEIAYSKDTNSPALTCEKISEVHQSRNRVNGLDLTLESGQILRVQTETYGSARIWKNAISRALYTQSRISLNGYLASRRKRNLPILFAGWLTRHVGTKKLRQFCVFEDGLFGFADDVDHMLHEYGTIADVGSSIDMTFGLNVTFEDAESLKLEADSLEDVQNWYKCFKAVSRRSSIFQS